MSPWTFHVISIVREWGLAHDIHPYFGMTMVFLNLIGAYLTYCLIYGFFFCPTRHIPGPFVTRFTCFYFYYIMFRGFSSSSLLELHEKYGSITTSPILIAGPVVRMTPQQINVQLPSIAQEVWGGQNEDKLPWGKVPEICRITRNGMKVDNIVSIQNAREALQMRRLVGPPFSRKFLLDQDFIFKRYVKKVIETIEHCRLNGDGNVDILKEFKQFALNVVCISPLICRLQLLISSRLCLRWPAQR